MWSAGRTLKTFGVLALLTALLLGMWLWYQDRPDLVFLHGLAAVDTREFQHVSNAVATLERYPEFRRHVYLLRGCVLLDSGDASAALNEFSRTRPEGVLRFPVLQFTAQALYSTGRSLEAAQLLIMLVNENPASAEAHRWLGAIYYDLGNQSAALAELSEAVRLNPLDYRPHRLLGVVCTDLSLYIPAIEHYRAALKLGKDIPQPEIEVDLAVLLIGRNHFKEALESLEDAQPSSTVWALRADCYDGLGQRDASQSAIAAALSADPDNSRALRLYGTQQLFDGSAENAIEPLQKLLRKDPYDTAARYQLAMAYLKLGQTDAWKREMDARDDSNKLHDRFSVLMRQADEEPANAEIREELAAIARTLGKQETAKRWELAAAACRAAVASAP